MIEVRNLTKYYGSVAAIKDVSFSVQEGEILAFLGPNAAGKTTTMRILTGFMPPTSGVARVAGFDVFEDSLAVRKLIGYMPETVPLYPEMTVSSYLSFVARIREVEDRKLRIERIMDICDVAGYADTLISKLSKGYRQRVGLAQALVHDPQVLVLDEPTIGLDPKQIKEVRQLIKSLAGDHTVLLSTHVLPEVSQVCERVVIINRGEVVAEGAPETLVAELQRTQRIFLQVREPAADVPGRLSQLEGVAGVEEQGGGRYEIASALGSDCRAEIASLVVNHGWGLLELRSVGMSLEEIFLELITVEEEGRHEEVA